MSESISGNKNYITFLLILVLVVFAWIFRWDIEAAGEGVSQHHKLDRWTGNSYFCYNDFPVKCIKQINTKN